MRSPARDPHEAALHLPSDLADRLTRGQVMDLGEREVTILFADLRGYATYAEARRADEIFAFVKAYTETVSGIVQTWGGILAEYSGDGAMAVFGAPGDLRWKEAAAVSTAHELLGASHRQGLTLGIGIATGPAFVGWVPWADRLIWCAVGNTPILASRLQELTRPFAASMVTDEATARGAGMASDPFVRHAGVQIRGRRQRETLFALPRRPALETPSTRLRAGDAPGGPT